jgi:predicted CopG family antitoxin
MNEVKNKFIIIRVTEDVKTNVVKLAKKGNQSISDFIRDILEKL